MRDSEQESMHPRFEQNKYELNPARPNRLSSRRHRMGARRSSLMHGDPAELFEYKKRIAVQHGIVRVLVKDGKPLADAPLVPRLQRIKERIIARRTHG